MISVCCGTPGKKCEVVLSVTCPAGHVAQSPTIAQRTFCSCGRRIDTERVSHGYCPTHLEETKADWQRGPNGSEAA